MCVCSDNVQVHSFYYLACSGREEVSGRGVLQCCGLSLRGGQEAAASGACVASTEERHWHPSLRSPPHPQGDHRDPIPRGPDQGEGGGGVR